MTAVRLCVVQAYVTNLNIALEKQDAAESKGDVQGLIALQGALKFNGGGHVNHTMFWQNLAPVSAGGGAPPEGELAKYIEKSYGSFDVRAWVVVRNRVTRLKSSRVCLAGRVSKRRWLRMLLSCKVLAGPGWVTTKNAMRSRS